LPGAGDTQDSARDQVPTLEELETLHRSLDSQQREELLECLLIAASISATAMMDALSPWLLEVAVQELANDTGDSGTDFS
jgi:hypothetical protein